MAVTGVQDPGGGGLIWGMTWGLGGLILEVAWGWPQGSAAPRCDRMHEDNMKMDFYWEQLKVDCLSQMLCNI